jgi:hypothetical protein
MKKENVVYLHNGILFKHKKALNPTVVYSKMEHEIIMLSGMSQTQDDDYHMSSVICRTEWNNGY